MANQTNTTPSKAVTVCSKLSLSRICLDCVKDAIVNLVLATFAALCIGAMMLWQIAPETLWGAILCLLCFIFAIAALGGYLYAPFMLLGLLRGYVAITGNTIILRESRLFSRKKTFHFDDIEKVYVTDAAEFIIATRATPNYPSRNYVINDLKNRLALYTSFWLISGREKPAELTSKDASEETSK